MSDKQIGNSSQNILSKPDDFKAGQKIIVPVGGMHCSSCAVNIEKSLEHVSGVLKANVNFIEENVTVYYDPYRVDLERIKKAIVKPGYTVRETTWSQSKSFFAEKGFFIQMLFCALLIISSWILALLKVETAYNFYIHFFTIADLLALAAVVVGGYSIFKGSIQALLMKDLTVFSLVSIASIAAILVGAYKEAGMVILIMLVGETLEKFALTKTKKSIDKLMKLAPESALVKRDGQERQLPIDQVLLNEVVIIKPGERIPVDGIMLSGYGSVNQAMITGESLPVDKKPGDRVYSGTINESGSFEVRVTQIGDDTQLAHIKRLIMEAEAEKAPIQRLADRYARYFIPIVLSTSLLVFIIGYLVSNHFSHSIHRSITILIVACPCALVLATPTAVVTALGKAARHGILIKGGPSLEAAGALDIILMDKTGTLTQGKIQVSDVKTFKNISPDEVIRLAAIAEKRSEHPIARAVCKKAEEMKLDVPAPVEFEFVKGMGVKVKVDHSCIVVGNRAMMEASGINISQTTNEFLTEQEKIGKTFLIVALNNEIVGMIYVSDILRSNVGEMVAEARKIGIKKVIMLTGDNQGVARAIAEKVGQLEFYAEMLPEDKVKKIK
ncbi:MAG: cation-translocating P-type ATPase, partial [Planctomycetota bacterium]